MFKTLIVLHARSFWVTECTPNPSWSFPHWPAPMVLRAPTRRSPATGQSRLPDGGH